jgi:DNA-binding MarR family transcriptional regulator
MQLYQQGLLVPPVTIDRPARGPGGRPPLGYLLRQAAAAHRLAMERLLADIEVTPPQFLVLRMLAEHPGSSNAELARMAALATPTVTVIVGNLTRRDAVTSRPHAVHGRVRHLDLTPTGAALLKACKQRAAKAEKALEADLAPADVDVIANWLLRSAQQDRPS